MIDRKDRKIKTKQTSFGARHNKPRPLLPPSEWYWLVSGLIFEIPILGYFGARGYFWAIWLLPMPNLMSRSCSATPISYCGDEISCLSRLVIEIPILGYLGVWGGRLGYWAASGAKSDVIFLLCNPDFLLGRQNFAPISLSYRDPHFGGLWGNPFTRIDPKCNQVVPWSLHTFPENFTQIGPAVFS